MYVDDDSDRRNCSNSKTLAFRADMCFVKVCLGGCTGIVIMGQGLISFCEARN